MRASLFGEGVEEAAQVWDGVFSAAVDTAAAKLEDPAADLAQFTEQDSAAEGGNAVLVFTALKASITLLAQEGSEAVFVDRQTGPPVETEEVFGVGILVAFQDCFKRDQVFFIAACPSGQSRPGPVFRFFDQSGSDRIQIDIEHAIDQRLLIGQDDGAEAFGKEGSPAVVVSVVPLAHGLFDVVHEVGDGEEAFIESFPLGGCFGSVGRAWVEDGGASLEFASSQTLESEKADDQVEVIAEQVVVGQLAAVDADIVEENAKEGLGGDGIVKRVPVDGPADAAHQMIEGVLVG